MQMIANLEYIILDIDCKATVRKIHGYTEIKRKSEIKLSELSIKIYECMDFPKAFHAVWFSVDCLPR